MRLRFCLSALMAVLMPALLWADGTMKQPNIIFILTDDQGYADMGAHGHPMLKTPVMDSLHKKSVRFEDFSVSPTCSPSRSALMSGIHEWKAGVTHTIKGRSNMRSDITILPQLLKSVGYSTSIYGKWHLGTDAEFLPGARGFDEYALGEGPGANRALFNPSHYKNGKTIKRTGYRTDLFYDDAVDFIQRHKDKTFFCYIASYSPHTPLGAPTSYTKPYLDAGVDKKTAPFFGMIANLDHNIGRVLKTLDACNISEKTLVILMNDNGGTKGVDTYNAGMRGTKAGSYRASTRAFSFWYWPGSLAPSVRNEMTAHIDVLPTLCDIAGVTLDERTKSMVEGETLLPLLNGTAADSKAWNNRVLVTHRGRWNEHSRDDAEHHRNSFVSLRWQKYAFVSVQPCTNQKCKSPECKVVKNPKLRYAYTSKPEFHFAATGSWKLFNLENDLDQSTDISREFPEIVAHLTRYYKKWWTDVISGIYPASVKK